MRKSTEISATAVRATEKQVRQISRSAKNAWKRRGRVVNLLLSVIGIDLLEIGNCSTTWTQKSTPITPDCQNHIAVSRKVFHISLNLKLWFFAKTSCRYSSMAVKLGHPNYLHNAESAGVYQQMPHTYPAHSMAGKGSVTTSVANDFPIKWKWHMWHMWHQYT